VTHSRARTLSLRPQARPCLEGSVRPSSLLIERISRHRFLLLMSESGACVPRAESPVVGLMAGPGADAENMEATVHCQLRVSGPLGAQASQVSRDRFQLL